MAQPIDVNDENAWERGRDHAWRYFDLHAGQRLTMFNYFTVLAGLTLAGIGATLQAAPSFSMIGILLGLLLALLSFVFWKIDQRVAFMVKHAESAHEFAERKLLPPEMRIFCGEPGAHATAVRSSQLHQRPWTFGKSLRFTFGAMAVIGIAAAILSTLRVTGLVTLEKPEVASKSEGSGTGGKGGHTKDERKDAATTGGSTGIDNSQQHHVGGGQKNNPGAAGPMDSVANKNSSVGMK